MTIAIEKAVPLPQQHRPTRSSKYPFADMEPGDSFLATDVKATTMYSSVARYVRSCGNTKKFTVRSVEGGVRVWRTH
jgi:hypothetical protein